VGLYWRAVTEWTLTGNAFSAVAKQIVEKPNWSPHAFFRAGQDRDVFWHNAYPVRVTGMPLTATAYSVNPTTLATTMTEGSGPLKINGSAVGDELHIITNSLQSGEPGYLGIIKTFVAPKASTGSARIMLVADSLGEMYMPAAISRVTAAMGMEIEFVGSKMSTGYDGLPGLPSEGRGGRDWADFIYAKTTALSPVADGTELETYIDPGLPPNQTEDYRRERFPFFRAAEIGDDPEDVNNGFVVDIQYGLERTEEIPGVGSGPIDCVLFCLGQNSTYQGDAAIIAEVTKGFNTYLRRCRAYHATMPIGFFMKAQGIRNRADWKGNYAPHQLAVATLQDLIRNCGDSNVYMIPVYMHQSTIGGFDYDVISTDPVTGIQRVRMGVAAVGNIHDYFANVDVAANVIADFIAVTLGTEAV
jgi:hypothetical protein